MYDAFWNRQILGESAVQEMQIFAQAEPSTLTVEATLTGGRIGYRDGIPFMALCHTCAHSGHQSSDFMAKASWCLVKE
jgi:hypothetical protein